MTTYGNGDKISYEYNSLGLVKSLTRTDTNTDDGKDEATKFSWSYSDNGTPRAHRDNVNKLRYTYDYDSLGRLVRSTVNTTDGDYVGMVEQGFDVRNNVNRLTTEFGGLTHTQQYFYETNTLNANSASYSKDNLPSAYKFSSNRYATYDYDSLNRLNKRTFTLNGRNLYNNYVYWLSDRNAEGSNLYRTTQLKTELVDNTAYTYTYDKVGNITEVKKGTRTNANTDNTASGSYSAYRSYVYDDLGQLTRENNATAGETHVFTYDSRGNRGTDTTYAYTTASSVANPVSQIKCVYGEDADAGWKKLVTSVDHYEWNDKGEKKLKKSEAMDYDEIGNPIVYRDADLLWNGRQLTSYEKEANEDEDEEAISLSYLYDADGLRTEKTTGDGVVTKFYYSGSKLAYQKDSAGNKLYFFYDASGNLSVIRQVTPTKDYHFYVTTNAQGDVLGIYSSTGTLLASYEYDAWGNCTIVTDNPTYNIGATNPIRYRGYYYDSETELYYLQSRYYDPEIGRFINCDDQISGVGGDVQGYNLYSYCYNNPVNLDDPTGHWPNWSKLIGGIGLAVTGMLAVAAVATSVCVAPVVAAVVGVAGLASMAMGAAEIEESFNGYNFVKEEVFQGNDEAYDVTRTIVSTVATVGTTYVNSMPVCFVAGTYILSQVGKVEIQDIKVGDKVWAANIETGQKELKSVVRTFKNESVELIHVFVNGEEIVSTPEHPFYLPVKGWTSACKLRAGDVLVLQSSQYVTVEKVQHELLESPITVYNFEVADFHTYYVGDSSVLVHNECEPTGKIKGNAPRNNQAQNKQFRSVVNELGLDKNQRDILHRKISGKGYSREEILDEAIYLFGDDYGK